MKQLFTAIHDSIYNPTFYRELPSKSLGYSWKYYSAFALLVVIFLTIISSIPLIGSANRVVREFPQKFFAYYPDNFEFSIANGVLTTNAVEPYTLPIPLPLRVIAKEDDIADLVVFDTKTPFSLEQFNAYHSLIWVGGKQFAYREKDTSVRVQGFAPKTNITVNEKELHTMESLISPYYRFIGPVIVLSVFTGLLVALGVNFLYLLLGAVFIFVLLRFMKKELSYAKCYQVGLHAMTLPVLVYVVLATTPFALSGLPFSSTIIMLVIVYINFREIAPTVAPDTAPAVSEEVKN
jgi:hypothetical protein